MLRLLQTTPSQSPRPAPNAGAHRQEDPLRALVQRVLRDDRAAERTLLLAVAPSLLAVVRRVLGANSPELDDVCQEASLSLLSALPTFRAECSVLHFACRIALLTAIDARRRLSQRGSRLESTKQPEELTDYESSDPALLIDAARRRDLVRDWLEELPLAQAEVLALHVMLGYTVEETASLVDAPINTVRSRLQRGLVAMRERLKQYGRLREIPGGRHE